MASEQWKLTREIWDAIEAHQGSEGDGKALRIVKLSEEIGEVAQAYVGFRGANRRKGSTHTEWNIANELVDVIITAMVAMEDWAIEPETFFNMALERVRKRVREQGS